MRTYDPKKVGVVLRRWQEESGLDGYEVAEKAGIKSGYFSEICSGTKPGRIVVLDRIVDVLGHTLAELFWEIQKPAQNHSAQASDEVVAKVETVMADPDAFRRYAQQRRELSKIPDGAWDHLEAFVRAIREPDPRSR